MTASIRAAATTGDLGEVGALAHRLKSSSRSVGAIALGDACAELENGSRLNDSAVAMAAVGTFEAAVENLLPQLKEHLEKGD